MSGEKDECRVCEFKSGFVTGEQYCATHGRAAGWPCATADPVGAIGYYARMLRRPLVRVSAHIEPTTVYAVPARLGERAVVVMHHDLAAKIGVQDGDELSEATT